MSAEQAAMGPTEYIVHHLHHLNSTEQASMIDFSVINCDTIFFSALMLALLLFGLYRVAKKATSGVPGRMQCACEMVMEFIEEQSKLIVGAHVDRSFITPAAITVFLWVTLMNGIDLLPVDLIPWLAKPLGLHYMRPLPTADLNGTMGISVGVLVLSIYYGIKAHGGAGYVKGLFTAPFGNNPILWPCNFILNIIEYCAKTVSLAMRLFGNMFAGELIFFLIALLGGYCLAFGVVGGAGSVFGHIVAGFCWWMFHVMIILLQAFIMMMLSLVYIGQAFAGH